MGLKLHLLLFLLYWIVTTVAAADDATAGCPAASEIVYSPFKPWFAFGSGSAQQCWGVAICTYEQADAARNQQFGATALVMGIVPLTLRDIAWPERRTVLVSSPLPLLAAIAVRALGLEPTLVDDAKPDQVERWMHWMNGGILTNLRRKSRLGTALLVAISFLALLVSFAALALVEIYSKRSAMGCPYPVFALTWCLVAIVPSALHAMFASWRLRRKNQPLETKRETAVQGADEAWPVQLAWAIYYIAGTLIFTSIMAVTVLELFVWVVVLFAVTGASKLFALYICLLLRGPVRDGHGLNAFASAPKS